MQLATSPLNQGGEGFRRVAEMALRMEMAGMRKSATNTLLLPNTAMDCTHLHNSPSNPHGILDTDFLRAVVTTFLRRITRHFQIHHYGLSTRNGMVLIQNRLSYYNSIFFCAQKKNILLLSFNQQRSDATTTERRQCTSGLLAMRHLTRCVHTCHLG